MTRPARSDARRSVRGVSLIEALVALAVMAFGMLGVVGMQSSLRANADLSRQRGEAMRMAQEEMERWRNYSCFSTAECPGQLAFEDIQDTGPAASSPPASNTEFTLSTDVTPEVAGAPRLRLVTVTVGWTDRRGEAQSVVLTTQIGYVPRELGALPAQRADRGPLSQPGGRSPLIPRAAVPYDTGRSRFDPPGGAGLGWLFNNDSGLIVAVCPPPPSTSCTPANRQLVAGSIGFALVGSPGPAASDAELPSSVMPTGMVVGMQVRYVLPTPASTVACFTETSTDRRRVSYYCAVPVTGALEWRGTVDPVITIGATDVRSTDLYPGTTAPPTSSTDAPTDNSASRYRVCRYTPVNINRRVLAAGYSAAELLAHNTQHPWQYFFAKGPYIDRNFLVIRAGDGSSVFDCPTEDTTTAIQSNTFHHPRWPVP